MMHPPDRISLTVSVAADSSDIPLGGRSRTHGGIHDMHGNAWE